MDIDQIDPHRPAVDRLTFPCGACDGTMQRVEPVTDAAFDSAVLPWATAPQPGPANVAIGLNHIRKGWLGDLAEASNLVRGKPAWLQAVALQEVEMRAASDSGHSPPADALRWAAFSGTTPKQAEQSFLRPLWSSVVQMLSEPESRPGEAVRQLGTGELLLDNWLSARLDLTIVSVAEALEICDLAEAAHHLARLVDDIVGWYVPHRPGVGSQTLGLLSQLLAPFVPHLAEAIYNVWGRHADESVHLTRWPSVDRAQLQTDLLRQMESVRRLTGLGKEARARAELEPQKPLEKALIGSALGSPAKPDELALFADLLAGVLGVEQVRFAADLAEQVQWQLALDRDRDLRQAISAEQIDSWLAALGAETAADLTSQLREGLSVCVEAEGQGITLLPDEVIVAAQAEPGWVAAADATFLLLLQTG
jgi:isoleucyl-tRNA synthetase